MAVPAFPRGAPQVYARAPIGRGIGEGILETTLRVVRTILTCDGALGLVSNQFGFHFTGLPGQAVVLEGSTDLFHWSPLQTNTLDRSPIYFSEPWSVQNSHRFYRLAAPE